MAIRKGMGYPANSGISLVMVLHMAWGLGGATRGDLVVGLIMTVYLGRLSCIERRRCGMSIGDWMGEKKAVIHEGSKSHDTKVAPSGSVIMMARWMGDSVVIGCRAEELARSWRKLAPCLYSIRS
eukprot:CCRYP_007750-RA/>CCRYP_007750-RA protein AED:0.47 eAED:1.00 QI:0/0/0/1/1/1/2/0/124